jgi:Immunoglobulin-like domain of bacterial spore germination/Sporulation and spore germination
VVGRASWPVQESSTVKPAFLLVTAVVLFAAGCGSGSQTTVMTVTTGQVPVSPKPMTITVFSVERGELRPKLEHVPQTQAVAAASLGALGVAAPVTISGGTATVDLAKATNDQVAEIVYTLTQFPSVQRVDVAGRTGLTRDDFAAYVPPILVETPAPGSLVPQTFHVSGTASVFEATLVVQLARDGKVISKQTVTASEGAPGRGTFDTTFTASAGALTVAAFSPSAADGTPQHEVDVPVTVTP